jgi:hypothetical protein
MRTKKMSERDANSFPNFLKNLQKLWHQRGAFKEKTEVGIGIKKHPRQFITKKTWRARQGSNLGQPN